MRSKDQMRGNPLTSTKRMAGQSEDALEYRLIKMTATGTILWIKTYGGNRGDHCFGLDLCEDGSIFSGHTLPGTISQDTYTIKLDSNGEKIWEQVVGNPRGFDPQWIHDETWAIWFPQTGVALKLELNLPLKLVLELKTSSKFSTRTTF